MPKDGRKMEMVSEKRCGCGGRCDGLPRREFLKVAGMGFLATSLGGARVAMAGPFGAEDTTHGHLVPADKKLAEAWIKSLFERGVKEVYTDEALENIGMPCGGIGAGQLYLCGDGTLGCWQVFNNAASNWVEGTSATYKHRGIAKPVDQGFAVVVDGTLKILNVDNFEEVEFRGEYPIGRVRYTDPSLPVTIEMEAFSPFIPLNAKDSGLPATVFHITVRNWTERRAVQVSAMGWLENCVCSGTAKELEGSRTTRFSEHKGHGVMMHGAKPAEGARQPKVFMDFENGYGAWEVKGTAFGDRPATGTFPESAAGDRFRGSGAGQQLQRRRRAHGHADVASVYHRTQLHQFPDRRRERRGQDVYEADGGRKTRPDGSGQRHREAGVEKLVRARIPRQRGADGDR